MSRLLLGGTLIVFVTVLSVAYLTLPQTPKAVITIDPALEATPSTLATKPSAPGTGIVTTPSSYTMVKVAQHNSASSCWAVVNGNVYDLTKWIDQHPGGQAVILAMCGTDSSDAFNGQHAGARRPANELAGFLLGPLAK